MEARSPAQVYAGGPQGDGAKDEQVKAVVALGHTMDAAMAALAAADWVLGEALARLVD